MKKEYFNKGLLDWYQQHKRNLPWRNTRDPYPIWLSEIILQQTRVEQGLPYYNRFLKRFPNVQTLAAADEKEVLQLWEGLGYYSRARNLHACAKTIMSDYHGEFPQTSSELLKLKGIGKYTSAAIASFAYQEIIPVVDGNVYRVLARLFNLEKNIHDSDAYPFFLKKAKTLISNEHPDDFNQAMMEFGATQCTPKSPNCERCIFKGDCISKGKELIEKRPVNLKKVKIRDRYFHYIVIRKGEDIYMNERKGKDIWKGLFDFFLIEDNKFLTKETLLKHEALKNVKIPLIEQGGKIKHILSHQRIFAQFYLLDLKKMPFPKHLTLTRVPITQVDKMPKPVLITKYLQSQN